MNEMLITQHTAIAAKELTQDLKDRFVAFIDAKPKTVETYSKAIRQLFEFFGAHGINRPSRDDIMAFREELKATGHKPTTIQNYITATRLFFQWTAHEGIYQNIAEHIKGATISRDHKKDYLTSRQVKAVLADIDRATAQGKRDYAMLVLMVTGGLRTIEVVRADVGDLRTVGDNSVLFIQGKGRDEKSEYVNLNAQVEAALRDYLKTRGNVREEDPLFTSASNNNRGQRMTTRAISGIAKAHMRGAGYNSDRLTAHSLRHTAVTLSLLAGKRLEEVQQFARHANIATTMIYNHALDRSKNGCSEAIAKAIF